MSSCVPWPELRTPLTHGCQNGAHAGYIMYVTDAAQSSTDVESLRSAMRDSKGLGNFNNLFFYAPNGKPDRAKLSC